MNIDTNLLQETLIRLSGIFGVGLLLVALFNLRNLKDMFHSEAWNRYIGWLIMAPAFLIGIFVGGFASLLLVGFMMFQALREFIKLHDLEKRYSSILFVNMVLSLIMAVWMPNAMTILPVLYIGLTVGMAILTDRPEQSVKKIAPVLLGSLWICYTLPHMILFRTLDSGMALLLLTGFSVALADIGSYSFGKLFYKIGFGTNGVIAASVSPNKTWAGTLGSLAGALTGTTLFATLAGNLQPGVILVTGAVIAGCAVAGDLTESLVKRSCSVKDSGSLIIGHGGMLDRVDSLLFTMVAVYHLHMLLQGGYHVVQ